MNYSANQAVDDDREKAINWIVHQLQFERVLEQYRMQEQRRLRATPSPSAAEETFRRPTVSDRLLSIFARRRARSAGS